MTNREKILTKPFKNVLLENTKYTANDLKSINPICDFFTCLCCRFREEKNCVDKMMKWLDEEAKK